VSTDPTRLPLSHSFLTYTGQTSGGGSAQLLTLLFWATHPPQEGCGAPPSWPCWAVSQVCLGVDKVPVHHRHLSQAPWWNKPPAEKGAPFFCSPPPLESQWDERGPKHLLQLSSPPRCCSAETPQ
jgi:hypothetical protein